MIPYLLVLDMEYLDTKMKLLSSTSDFNFHQRCGRSGVVHMCIADDLLMFCLADIISITLLHKNFQNFSKWIRIIGQDNKEFHIHCLCNR